MNGPPKRQDQRAGWSRRDSGKQAISQPTGDRRQYQGVCIRRHASQRPPRWTAPRGADAAAALEAAFGPTTRYVVYCEKSSSGVKKLFQRYATYDEAAIVAEQLRSFGCAASVEVQR